MSFIWQGLYQIMFILPVMRDHLSWETTKFGGHFVQVSLYLPGQLTGSVPGSCDEELERVKEEQRGDGPCMEFLLPAQQLAVKHIEHLTNRHRV